MVKLNGIDHKKGDVTDNPNMYEEEDIHQRMVGTMGGLYELTLPERTLVQLPDGTEYQLIHEGKLKE